MGSYMAKTPCSCDHREYIAGSGVYILTAREYIAESGCIFGNSQLLHREMEIFWFCIGMANSPQPSLGEPLPAL